jgi:hypothetical protein
MDVQRRDFLPERALMGLALDRFQCLDRGQHFWTLFDAICGKIRHR